ncbi:MAG: CapA family protein [Patescibacteria group bacterium]
MKKHYLYLATIFFLSGLCLLLMIFLSRQIKQQFPDIKQQDSNQTGRVLLTLYPTSAPTPTPSLISLVFAGDAMFDRHIRQNAQEKGNYDFILADLESFFSTSDLVIINLEGPLTDYPSVSVNTVPGSSKNYIFTFDPLVATTLKNQNILLVNLGNNHILNFGEDGLQQTYLNLEKNGVNYFGNPGPESEAEKRIFYFQKNDFVIAFVNYNQFVSGGEKTALDDIQLARSSADFVILYTHWGNEYQPNANQVIVNQAHKFIDVGVDLIIGSHPHVIQNVETYKNKTIYYSLGNFVFDQYFSTETKQGLVVKATLNPLNKQISFEEVVVEMSKDGRTSQMIE